MKCYNPVTQEDIVQLPPIFCIPCVPIESKEDEKSDGGLISRSAAPQMGASETKEKSSTKK